MFESYTASANIVTSTPENLHHFLLHRIQKRHLGAHAYIPDAINKMADSLVAEKNSSSSDRVAIVDRLCMAVIWNENWSGGSANAVLHALTASPHTGRPYITALRHWSAYPDESFTDANKIMAAAAINDTLLLRHLLSKSPPDEESFRVWGPKCISYGYRHYTLINDDYGDFITDITNYVQGFEEDTLAPLVFHLHDAICTAITRNHPRTLKSMFRLYFHCRSAFQPRRRPVPRTDFLRWVLLAAFPKTDITQIMDIILDMPIPKGAQVYWKDDFERFCNLGYPDVIDKLIQKRLVLVTKPYRAKREQKGRKTAGVYPLHVAIASKHLDVIRVVVDASRSEGSRIPKRKWPDWKNALNVARETKSKPVYDMIREARMEMGEEDVPEFEEE